MKLDLKAGSTAHTQLRWRLCVRQCVQRPLVSGDKRESERYTMLTGMLGGDREELPHAAIRTRDTAAICCFPVDTVIAAHYTCHRTFTCTCPGYTRQTTWLFAGVQLQALCQIELQKTYY